MVYGIDIPLGTTAFAVTVGAGGNGGSGAGNIAPANGGSSSVTIPGYGTITAAGGAAAGNTSAEGASPGLVSFNGTTYIGGALAT